MRPFSLNTEKMSQETYPSNTYAMKKECIEGYVDGLEAVKQAVEKILNTDRYEYPIYSFSYGVELQKLVGKEQPYVRAELKRIITEALLRDDRIKSVSDFAISFDGDRCDCFFSVKSIYGNIPSRLEVMV